jgi:tetratricopeptide (TPR) repeat protein
MAQGLISSLWLAALSFATPAWADANADCRQLVDLDRTIRGCSQVISAGPQSRPNLAAAYMIRGFAYGRKGDFDRVVTDETQAIQLNPQLGDAYHNRAGAYNMKGEYDLSIADENEAIRLNPHLAAAYSERGFAYGAKRDFDREIADENRAIEIDPNHPEPYASRGYAFGQKGDYDRDIADQNEAIRINAQYANAYGERAYAFSQKHDYDRAIADATKAIDLKPGYFMPYANRGTAYDHQAKYDLGIADESKSIELAPRYAVAYAERGLAYKMKGDYDRAIADETQAIQLDPKFADAYRNRGFAYLKQRDNDRSIADDSQAIELKPTDPSPLVARGAAYGNKGDFDREIADETKALELRPSYWPAYYSRGEAYAAKGDSAKALVDFRIAAPLAPTSDERHRVALARTDELEKKLASVAPAVADTGSTGQDARATDKAGPAIAGTEMRLALVIGNSSYAAVGKLPNPERDAEAITAALKADGFDVTTVDNLTRADFIDDLKKFSDRAAKAEWAVIYFAGHGLQLDGVNYLIPIDAKLAEDRDVRDEAIALDRAVEAVSGARELGLIIVDACRNNPFLANMRFTVAARAAHTRGLARIEPQGTTLVEFSARDGQEALDGDSTGNSPFASALAKRLAEPGLEVNMLFRQLRKDVLAATANQQEPMFSGDLPPEAMFFRAAQ